MKTTSVARNNSAANINVVNGAAKRTAAQQASLDAMRIAKAAAAPEPVVEAPTVAPVSAQPKDTMEEIIVRAVTKMLFGEPDENAISWKRKAAALFGSVVISGGVGYGIGTLAGYAMVAIATLGGSALWSYLIAVIALMLAVYAGFKIGQHVGGYILSGQIDRDVAAVKDRVFGWFKTKPVVVALAAA